MHKHNQSGRVRTIAVRRLITRWTCGTCGAINPVITGTCMRCGRG